MWSVLGRWGRSYIQLLWKISRQVLTSTNESSLLNSCVIEVAEVWGVWACGMLSKTNKQNESFLFLLPDKTEGDIWDSYRNQSGSGIGYRWRTIWQVSWLCASDLVPSPVCYSAGLFSAYNPSVSNYWNYCISIWFISMSKYMQELA